MNQLLQLPFFSDADRALARGLQASAASHQWLDPEQGDDRAALKSALQTLAQWGTLKLATTQPWRLTSMALAREVLAYHAGIADLALAMQGLGALPLLLGGSPAQQALLPGAAAGEHCLAFAITEPDAGSDLSRIALAARRERGDYVLEGVKHLVSNVGTATHYVTFARTSAGGRGITAFVVPADSPGLRLAPQVPISPHPLGRMDFLGVRLPESSRIGAEGDGMKLALATLGRMRVTVAAAANGFARRALDEALAYARRRELFGATLAEKPLAQALLAEMRARLDASQLLTYRAAWEFDQGRERIPLEAAIAKWQATENAQWIIDKALQLAGGQGVLQGSVFERLYREIRPLRIYEGASEVQQLVIAGEMLKEPTRE